MIKATAFFSLSPVHTQHFISVWSDLPEKVLQPNLSYLYCMEIQMTKSASNKT